MAIDKNRTQDLLKFIDGLFNDALSQLPEDQRDTVKKLVFGPALEEIKQLIEEARPPVLFLIGRSGHGKSSLINALANRKVAEVGDVKPTTGRAIPYFIPFEDRYASWSVIDTRGFFETTRPEDSEDVDSIQQLVQDIREFKPDVILHVVAAPEVRSMQQDFELFNQIASLMKGELGAVPPTIIVLNKVDTLGNPRDWPPEISYEKAGHIKAVMDYLSREVLGVHPTPIDRNNPLKGYVFSDQSNYIAVIPVCSYWNGQRDDRWNILTLSEFIGEHLPRSAQLDFYQAQRRKELLKKVSTSLIKRFSGIAAGIGAIPVPVSDIMVLVPLQTLMITVIGALSCRPLDKSTAMEFLSAAGVNIGAGFAFRTVARQLVKLLPGFGSAISGGIAYAGTYSIGKAAEAYFFEGKIRKPAEFKEEAEKEYQLIGEKD